MIEKKWDVFIYGDVNVDIVIPGVKGFPLPGQEDIVKTMNTYVGGGAALFALGLGKLGLHSVFHGSIGNDCYGQMIKQAFQNQNVDQSLLSISENNQTGISLSFTNDKDRAFLTYLGTNEEMDLGKIDLAQVSKARHIHITQYGGSKNHGQYHKLLQEITKLKDVTVSFDVGWDSTEEWYAGIYELLPYIDVLFMNETEAIHYGRKSTALEAIKDFSKYGRVVVAKMGKRGSIAIASSEIYEAKPFSVKVVDTTGAGDSFNAGFIYGYLKEKMIPECLRIGNACGALSVAAYGGNTGFPTEKELFEFIKSKER